MSTRRESLLETKTQRHEENSARISRLESAVASVSESFSNFTREVKVDLGRVEEAITKIAVQQAGGKSMNWPAAGVSVAAFGLLAAFAGFALNSTANRIEHERAERLTLESRLDRTIEREQDRNNRIERDLGGALRVLDLVAPVK